ncbi:unnamed protein product [Ectocarpus sp. 12 AP-2014]
MHGEQRTLFSTVDYNRSPRFSLKTTTCLFLRRRTSWWETNSPTSPWRA